MHPRFALLALLALTACKGDDPDDTDGGYDPYDVPVGPYDATVNWTEYGIPHIQAEDHGSLGYGLGYAFARDHVCVLADQIVKVRSERAAYFGRGDGDANMNSDFGYKALKVVSDAEDLWEDIRPEIQDTLVGYAAGYNRYVSETDASELPQPCQGAEWVKPITHIDLVAYHLHLGLLGSGYNLIDYIATAEPPDSSGARRHAPPALETLQPVNDLELGSNGWAIGGDKSTSGGGMLLSNTHFPTTGERQWYEFHLTGPNDYDVYGVSLVGVPVVNIGFNRHVAWTHTVSNTPRFTVYTLTLDPDDPTRYEYAGEMRSMVETTHTIEVLGSDGSLTTESRTLYDSVYGPVLNAPVIGWTPLNAFTYRDVNEGNISLYDTWFEMNQATDLDSFTAAHRDHLGIPWVHTMAADAEGNALYMDSARTPNLSPESYQAWLDYMTAMPIAGLFYEQGGLIVFPADDPTFAWQDDDRSPIPGVVPLDDSPMLSRTDFVANANDNYWLSNPAEPLSGAGWIYGRTDTPRTPRTKMNLRYLMQTGEDSAAGADGTFSLDELEAAQLSARSSIAEDLREQLVTRCTGVGEVTVDVDGSSRTVDLTDACATLAAWDGTHRIESRGAVVMREWLSSGTWTFAEAMDQGGLFADAFDPNDPVYTPTTLQPAPESGTDPVIASLAMAVARMDDAGIAVDDELGDAQFRRIGEHDIPTQGGRYQDGTITIADYGNGGDTTLLPRTPRGSVINGDTDLTDEGYVINGGNSWIMTMSFEDDGPHARAVMVYSQSEDSRSPHFVDQSELYATQTFRDVLFEQEDILASEALETMQLTLE